MNVSPIVFIDEDQDDQLLFRQALIRLSVAHPVVVFTDGQASLDYLTSKTQLPFLIISELSMPRLSGLELRHQLEQDSALRKKTIPFTVRRCDLHNLPRG